MFVFLNKRYTHNGAPHSLSLKLPVMINKFFEGTNMNASDFFGRWKQLGQ